VKTRLVLLTVLGLATARASAQAPAAPSGPPPAAAPAASAPPPAAAPPAEPVLLEWETTHVDGAPTQAPPPYVTPPGAPVRMLPPQLHPIEPPPEPRRHGDATAPFALGIGGSVLWHRDHDYALTEQKHTGAFELFATYDVWTPMRGLVLAAGVSLRNESRTIDFDYDLRQNTVQAELMARLVATSWLHPHVRIAVGGVITNFSRTDSTANVTYEDRSGGVASTFGAGFTLRTPPRLFETHRGRMASLSLGVLVEGGYALNQDAELDAKPTQASEIERATFSFGTLDRSAGYLRIAGVIRF